MLFSKYKHIPARPTEPRVERKKKCNITILPRDILLLIRDELLKHKDTNFDHFKAYRTVCRIFDDVWSPVVLSSVSLFPLLPWPTDGDNIHTQFRYLIDAPERFASTRTISIKNWHCLNTDFSEAISQAWKSSAVEGMMTTLALLIFGPPVELVKSMVHPLDVPDRVKQSWWTYQARRYAALLPQRLNLPNVRCARLFFRDSETKWVISCATRVLLAVSELTELEIFISGDANTPYMSKCLTQITSLCKLTIKAHAVSAKSYGAFYPDIESFRTLLACNPNLTHLSLRTAYYERQSDLSELLRDIPADRPLKLEYLALSKNFSPCAALLPHIRTLTSFSFCATCRGGKSWGPFLTQASIFPPTVKVNYITNEVFTYLSRHPGLVSLSVIDGKSGDLSLLSRILAHHSKTLRSLLITSQSLAFMLVVRADQDNFRECTNLQELVLYHHGEVGKIGYEKKIMNEVGRLGNSLLLVLTDKLVYSQCVKYSFICHDRDLAKRIVYERRQPLE